MTLPVFAPREPSDEALAWLQDVMGRLDPLPDGDFGLAVATLIVDGPYRAELEPWLLAQEGRPS